MAMSLDIQQAISIKRIHHDSIGMILGVNIDWQSKIVDIVVKNMPCVRSKEVRRESTFDTIETHLIHWHKYTSPASNGTLNNTISIYLVHFRHSTKFSAKKASAKKWRRTVYSYPSRIRDGISLDEPIQVSNLFS